MKKKLCMLLVTALCTTLLACGSTQGNTSSDSSTNTETQTQDQVEPATEEKEAAPATETVSDTESTSVDILVYFSNDNADGLDSTVVSIDALTPQNVLAAIIETNGFPTDITLITFTQNGIDLTLDLSSEFQDYIFTQGTTGEELCMASLVNTFLGVYDSETITVLVEGSSWESGHVEYADSLGVYTFE